MDDSVYQEAEAQTEPATVPPFGPHDAQSGIASALGITTEDIALQIRNGFFGAEVQRLPRDGEDVRVYVRYPRLDRESLDFLNSMRIRTSDGRQLPLSSVANLRYEKGISQIRRRDRQRAVVISAEVASERTQEVRDAL